MKRGILSLFLLLLFSGTAFGVLRASPGGVRSPVVSGSTAVQTIALSLQTFVAPTIRPPRRKELQRLVVAIKSVETAGVRMTDSRRLRIARAALKASKATGVDAVLLIAVARQESDFREIQGLGPRCRDLKSRVCGADCGLTQHYITGYKGWVVRRCRQIAKNYSLSFLYSAKEIAYHIRWCNKQQSKGHRPLQRCVLNRYNSGTYYRTPKRCSWRYRRCIGVCTRGSAERVTCLRRCRYRRQRCRLRANYWLAVLCFDYGARNGLRATKSCRGVWRVQSIPRLYSSPQ